MICKSCSYSFLFDPQKDHLSGAVKLHDKLFEKIIRHASADSTYAFTPNQFFSSARHFGRKSRGCCLFFVITMTAVLAMIAFTAEIPGHLIFLALIAVFLMVTLSRLGSKGPTRKAWDRFVKRWQKDGRPIPGLIDSPALQNPPPDWEEKDIYDYGVSALLLCDRPETVDLLVLNQFHAQTNTLILTASGYPSYLLEKADSLLAQSPDLPVYLLHDPATDPGTMKNHCPLAFEAALDLGLAPHTLSQLGVLRKRFHRRELPSLPLDVMPYRTLSASLTHCLAHGLVLDSVLGAAGGPDSDTDISFG